MACAWGGFAGYGISMILSYFFGQKYYPINYPLKDIGIYTAVAAAIYAACVLVKFDATWLNITYRTALMLVFVAVIYKRENLGKMLKKAPVIGRFFK